MDVSNWNNCRRTTYRSTNNWLLTLLLVLVVVVTASNQVNGASLGLENYNPKKVNQTKDQVTDHMVGSTQVRKHRLSNHCSNRLVKVVRRGGKGVNARGRIKPEMHFSTIVFITTAEQTIVMRGEESNNYICISRSGRPTARAKRRKSACEFTEEYATDKSTKVYKLADPTREVYLGFDKNGRPMKGSSKNFYNKKKQKCFMFSKLPYNLHSKEKCPQNEGGGPKGITFCDMYLAYKKEQQQTKANTRKRRHNRHHKDTRNDAR